MKDKLSVFDRRTEILSRLFWEKIITMRELAIEFDVSEDTIWRDIVYLRSGQPPADFFQQKHCS